MIDFDATSRLGTEALRLRQPARTGTSDLRGAREVHLDRLTA
jgi:hypothetical protein